MAATLTQRVSDLEIAVANLSWEVAEIKAEIAKPADPPADPPTPGDVPDIAYPDGTDPGNIPTGPDVDITEPSDPDPME